MGYSAGEKIDIDFQGYSGEGSTDIAYQLGAFSFKYQGYVAGCA
jgi:hypothetical protein